MHGPWFYVGGSGLLLLAVGFMFVLLYLAFGGAWSLHKRRRCRQLAEQAAKMHREGDASAAVRLYLKAEGSWALNRWDGGRDSLLKDLDLLSGICSGLVRLLAREPGTIYADLNATIREMRDVLRERQNFGVVDNRKMLPDVTVRWRASLERLNGLRSRLRQACQSNEVARR